MNPGPDDEQVYNDISVPEVLLENAPDTKKQATQNRLLVIENDSLNSLFMTAGLRQASVPFLIVSSEKEAMMQIRKLHFDIVIVSINDPENFKYELFQRIKNDFSIKLSLIAITCLLTKNHISNEQQEIFDHILINPYSVKELHQLITESRNATTTEPLSPDHKPSFNLEQLQKISNNNEEFITKMLDKFVITALECSEALTQGATNHDLEKIRKAAHKAIPSYAIMGLNELVVHLENLETNVLSISEDNIQNIVSQFTIENKQTISDIKDYQKHLRK